MIIDRDGLWDNIKYKDDLKHNLYKTWISNNNNSIDTINETLDHI